MAFAAQWNNLRTWLSIVYRRHVSAVLIAAGSVGRALEQLSRRLVGVVGTPTAVVVVESRIVGLAGRIEVTAAVGHGVVDSRAGVWDECGRYLGPETAGKGV